MEIIKSLELNILITICTIQCIPKPIILWAKSIRKEVGRFPGWKQQVSVTPLLAGYLLPFYMGYGIR
jgi:hypothetical protein